MDTIIDAVLRTLEANAWLAPLAAFLGGLLTAANPCVLASVPPLMACVAADRTELSAARAFRLSLSFSVGLTLTFLVMFLAAWAASPLLSAAWWGRVAAAVCLLMGLQLAGWLQLSLPGLGADVRPGRGLAGALALGSLFGLVSLPCAGPVLLALLALVPARGALAGGVLLAAYGLGHCALLLLGGTSIGVVRRLLGARAGAWAVQRALQRVAGAVLIGVGLTLLFG